MKNALVPAIALGLAAKLIAAEPLPFLHPLFSDHGVIQQGERIPVWGWTTPGAAVHAKLGTMEGTGIAGADGRWEVLVGPFTASQGPLTLTVDGPQHVTVSDLLPGEVWLCSGQSNMSWTLSQTNDGAEATAAADHPRIRLYNIPSSWALDPQASVNVTWTVCTPETAADFSGVGYHFGRELQERLGGVPIGLISAAFSGAAAECFLSPQAITRFGEFDSALAEHARVRSSVAAKTYSFPQEMSAWWRTIDRLAGKDSHLEGIGIDTSTWETTTVPGAWQEHGHPRFHGFVWYRRAFDLPTEAAGKTARLDLGPIDDRDSTWINGVLVGEMNNWVAPRHYDVPKDVLKPGRNEIAVRILDTGGFGGFTGHAKDMELRVDQGPTVALSGPWAFHQSLPVETLPTIPVDYDWPMTVPSLQYNALIHPIAGYPLAGVTWYQGESNGTRPGQYRSLLPAMIADWRQAWDDPKMPFLLVQIAGIAPAHEQPVTDNPWAATMEAQAFTASTVPHVGLATAADLGFDADIHPKDKRTVAHRLLFPALSMVYGRKDVVAGSPAPRSIERSGDQILIHFENAGKGLEVVGKRLGGFAVVGGDGRPVWAEAHLVDQDTVALTAPSVANPKEVLFNYDNNPRLVLRNRDGLPALPFKIAIP